MLDAIGTDMAADGHDERDTVKNMAKETHTEILGKTARKTKRDSGFTLVELLVVVVIMGVLSTVSVFAVRGIADRGQESACSSDKRVLEVAVETWFADESLSTSGTLSEQALVDADLLRSLSTLYDVQADGSVTATQDGVCDVA